MKKLKYLLILFLILPIVTHAYIQVEIEDQTTKYTYSTGSSTISFGGRSDHYVIAPEGGVGYGCGNGYGRDGEACGLLFKMCKLGGNGSNPKVTSVLPFYSLQGDSTDTHVYSTNMECRVKIDGTGYDGHLVYIHFDNVTSQFIIINNTREYYRWGANVTLVGSENGYYSVAAYSVDVIPDYVVDAFNNWLTTKNDNTIINQNTQIIDGQQQIDDSINNDNVDDNNVTSKLDAFKNMLAQNSTITSLLTMPITLYTAVLNSLDTTCQPYSMGTLFQTEIVLPCINIQTYVGSTIWGVIDVLFTGLMIFHISRKMIKVFEHFSSLKEGDVIND